MYSRGRKSGFCNLLITRNLLFSFWLRLPNSRGGFGLIEGLDGKGRDGSLAVQGWNDPRRFGGRDLNLPWSRLRQRRLFRGRKTPIDGRPQCEQPENPDPPDAIIPPRLSPNRLLRGFALFWWPWRTFPGPVFVQASGNFKGIVVRSPHRSDPSGHAQKLGQEFVQTRCELSLGGFGVIQQLLESKDGGRIGHQMAKELQRFGASGFRI